MTHGFGLAVSSCHCFTELISSSIHFVFAGLERGKYEEPEVGEGDKVLVLGDYLGSQKVGEGGELCVLVSQKGEVGKVT